MLEGIRWADGGRDPAVGIDCMGFMLSLYLAAGIEVPDLATPDGHRMAPGAVADFAKLWREVDDGEALRVGDVGLLRKSGELDFSHVGVLISSRWFADCQRLTGITRRPVDVAKRHVGRWMRYAGPGAEALE